MTRNIGSVLRLSMVVRNLPALPNRALPLRLLHSSTILEKRFKESLIIQSNAASKVRESDGPSKPAERITQKLRKCRTSAEILKLVRESSHQMNGSTLLICLSYLREIERATDGNLQRIGHKKEFGILCNSLKANMKQLSETEAINAFRFLTNFGVPMSSMIIQSLLQMIREQVHQLPLEEVTFLMYVLSKSQKNPAVEALDAALQIVFETRATMKLNTLSIKSLTTCLKHLRTLNVSSSARQKILEAIEETPRVNITSEQAKILLFCLLDFEADEHVKTLVSTTLQILAGDIQILRDDELFAMLLRITKNNDHKQGEANIYYHEGFVDAVANTVISRDLGFSAAIHTLDFLNEMNHASTVILDYIAAKCFEDEKIIETADTYQILRLLSSLSQANYKPPFWETMKESLTRTSVLESRIESSFQRSMKLGLQAVTLELYWPKLFAKIFTQYQRRNQNYVQKKQFLLFYTAVKRIFPEYDGPWPTQEVLENSVDISLPVKSHYLLQSAIETVLGGPQYVITNMKTRLGDSIDHVVIMRKGGFPIAINNNSGDDVGTTVEDLQLLPESQVLLFICLPEYASPRNKEHLTGIWSLILKQIEMSTNHTVIPVHTTKWNRMSESEQIRYISQIIRVKCNEFSALVS